MYHPEVVAHRVRLLEERYKPAPLRAYTPAEVDAWIERLADAAFDKKGQAGRPLEKEERAFITNELILTKADFRYWGERYCTILIAGNRLGKLYPLWESQELLVDRWAELELKIHHGEHDGGILFNILKARQLGASTLCEGAVGHRATTQSNLQGIIASDVPGPEGSGYLFGMFERIWEHLPWYLRPPTTDHVKDKEIAFEGGTHVWVAAGKSMKGAEGERGQMGRGKTIALGHLTELSTWEDPSQLDDALYPTIPPHEPRVFFGQESTGKGRNNWWHKSWDKAVKGLQVTPAGGFSPIFIPWYAETSKYARRAPLGWAPSLSTIAHAKRCEETGERWMRRPVRLTREQLYWYETTRMAYEEDDNLAKFLEEFSAEPEEAFQFSGKGVFSVMVQQRIREQARPLIGLCEVAPQRELV